MKNILSLNFLIILLASNAWAMARKPAEGPMGSPENSISRPVLLDLWDCYKLALARSETLDIIREEIKRTLANFLGATWESIGDLDFVMTHSRQKSQDGQASGGGSVGGTFTASSRRENKFVFAQPIFQGFKAVGALSGAGSLRKQRFEEWQRAKQLLFLEVVEAFYDLLRQHQDVEIIKSISSLFDERIEELAKREDIGRSRPSEVATARSRYEIFQAELARTRGNLALVENLMEFILGIPVDREHLKEDAVPQTVLGEELDIETGISKRPDVEATDQAVKTARGGMVITQSDLWPHLTLDSNFYEKREGFQAGIDWDLLFTFKVPLGKGGETVAQIRDAVSDWKEAKLEYSRVKRTAEREIKDAYESWKSALERYQALEKAVKAAQENFDFQKEDYDHNLVSNLDVLEALQILFETRRDANEALYDMKKSYWQLEVAKGNCCRELKNQ